MKTKIIGMLIALMFCCGCVSEAKYDLTPEENAWLQQHPTIKIGVSTDWSPYEFIDSTQRYTGIIGNFFKENCQLLGIKFQIDTLSTSWDTTLTLIAQKQIDVLPGVVYLPERDRYLLFTQSYLEATFVIVTVGDRHGSERVTTLNGKTVACQQGWATGNHVQELFPQARLTQKMNVDEIVADLLIGKADVAVIDINTFKYLREQRHMELLSICSDITFQIKVATGIRNDWPELVSILNKVYRQNSQTMLNEIKGRWMPDISYQHERYRKKMFIAGCIVMVLIIASLIVIFRLSIVNSIKSKLIARQRDESISQGNKYMLLENIFASSFKTSIHAELILKNGHIIAFNQKALETFGVSETEILGKQMLDFSPEYQPDGAKSTDQFERLWGNIAENEQLTFDWMCMTYSQSATFSAEVHLTRFVYDGKTYNTIVIKDVTQEREVQRELMGYRQHLEKMVADKTNELENANKHLQSLNTELDTANEELATSNAELLQIKERLEQANEALSLEVDKHLKTLETNKVLEETLKQFIEQSSDGIIITNDKGDVETWNQAMVRIMGVEREQVVGSSLKSTFTNALLEGRNKQMVEEFFADIENGTAHSIKFEMAMTTPDETTQYLHVTLFPIVTQRGFFTGGIVADITQRKAIAADLEDYRMQLETIIAKNSEKLVQLSERFNEV